MSDTKKVVVELTQEQAELYALLVRTDLMSLDAIIALAKQKGATDEILCTLRFKANAWHLVALWAPQASDIVWPADQLIGSKPKGLDYTG